MDGDTPETLENDEEYGTTKTDGQDMKKLMVKVSSIDENKEDSNSSKQERHSVKEKGYEEFLQTLFE